jgi:steroid 5-alpha reductase family enzyme
MLHAVLFVYGMLFLQMLVVWLIYLKCQNPSIVDVAWPIGLMMTGITFLYTDISVRTIASGILLCIWGSRLAGYIWYTRIRKHQIDKRYLQISADWKISKSIGFLLNYQLQGLLILAIALVFYPIASTSDIPLSCVDYIAILTIIIGIIGETIADYQLFQFKKDHVNQVCSVGLWRYSRHPNYFFDWLVWLGFALLSLQSPVFCLGFIAPILLYYIFNYVTGPITETGSLKSKGQAFIDYQNKTSMFFPWFTG